MRAVIAAMLGIAALPAAADVWHLKEGSSFTFEATFEGEPLEGHFTDFDVAFDFDPQQSGDDSLQVSVELAAADMGDPDMNQAIAATEWFDVSGFPRAQFTSYDIVETAPGSFVAHGVLVLKGIRRDIDVPFQWSAADDTSTMLGEFTLRRTDFNIGTGEWASGEQIDLDVKLRFDLQLGRAN
jgi:polyisoprenoid-binding protein YceI